MKKILFVLLTMCICLFMQAQDIILKNNGEQIQAKVQEVGISEIKYKRVDNPAGPLYTIAKSDVFMITYENGSKDIFTSESTPPTNEQPAETSTNPVTQEQATVILYRKNSPSGWAVVYDVLGNDKYITKIQNNTYFATKMDAGLVIFSAQTEPPKVITSVNLEAGKTYYIRCGVSSGVWVGRPSLELVSESTGINETARMKR